MADSGSRPTAAAGLAAIAWLALLLVLLLAAVGVWMLLAAQQRESELQQRLQVLEVGAGRDVSVVEQISRSLQRQLELELAAAQTVLRGEWQTQLEPLRERARQLAGHTDGVSRLQKDVTQRVASLEAGLDAAQQSLNQTLAAVDSQLARQRARLDRFSADDRDSWLLAEAQYLLRLANQRLVMTGDAEAVGTLLGSVDNILRELDDAGLLDVRRALAEDMAALRAAPRLDLERLYRRLDALIEQAATLAVNTAAEQFAETALPEAEDWRGRARSGVEAALQKLSNYVVFRRRDVPVEAIMHSQWADLLRQNLWMLLEQSRIALLAGDQRLFRESLQRARSMTGQFVNSNGPFALAMIRELEALEATPIRADVPTVLQSMQAMMVARPSDADTDP